MIAWWWLLVVLGVWVLLVGVAASRDPEVWEALTLVGCTAAAVPLLPVVWVLSRLDVGVLPISARALEQFARMRSADQRPAWLFYTRGSGVIVLRRWERGSRRRKVEIRVRDVDPLVGGE